PIPIHLTQIKVAAFLVSLFFFFQAEDGIRDLYVTGVQTCALPISVFAAAQSACLNVQKPGRHRHRRRRPYQPPIQYERFEFNLRSEERRVGKECRCWWLTYHSLQKQSIRLWTVVS